MRHLFAGSLNKAYGRRRRRRRFCRPLEITRPAAAIEVLESRLFLSAVNPTRFADFGSLKFDLSSYSRDRILVQISEEATKEEIADLFSEWDDNELYAVTELTSGLYQVYVSGSTSVEAAVEDYRMTAGVAMAEFDYVLQLSAIAEPDDPSFSSLWGLNNTGQTGGLPDADIDALEAWETTTGSSDVVVAVIDTGIDYTHPDLAARMWTNAGEVAGNGIDDDGNGFVDDVYGYDFHNDDGDPFDDHGHGTHVAGTIAAAGNNGLGVIGVAPNVSVMALKFLSGGGWGYTSNAVRAVDYAVRMGALISNNSWGGGGFSSTMLAALENAREAGHIFVAAAGNSGTDNDSDPHYPSGYDLDNVISVAATDHSDALAWFSNFGAATVDLAAPGVNILSTTPGNTYSQYSGTSMATPHVAGAVALVMSRHPEWSYDRIINQVLSTTDFLGDLDGKVATGGRLNVASALGAPAPMDDHHGDTAETATGIEAWEHVNGNIGTETDVDYLSLAVNAGLTYTFNVNHGSLENSTLTLYDADGTTLLDFHNGGGTGSGAQIVWEVAADQTVYLKVAGATAGDQGSYSVYASHSDDYGDSYLESTTVTLGLIDGVLETDGDVDFFSLQVRAGETYAIETELGSLADSFVTVYDNSGAVLDFNDDAGNTFASRLLFTADYTGAIHIGVRAYASTQTGTYQLKLNTPAATAMDSSGSGDVETKGGADFYGFHVDEGYTYIFEVTLGTLPDSWVDLYNAAGDWVTYDDDGGDGYASRLEWTATYTGNAFIGVEGFGYNDTGSYDFALTQIVQPPLLQSPLEGAEATTFTSFDWSTVAGADHYEFQLTDLTSGVVVHSDTNVPGNSCELPFNLEVGHNYSWRVRAVAPSGYRSGWVGSGAFTVINQAPVLQNLVDQTMPHSTDAITLNYPASDVDNHLLSYSAMVVDDPAALLAWQIDQAVDIEVYPSAEGNDYWRNTRGYNERYLVGHFILPNGALYRWGGSISESTLIGTLDSRYYDDPMLLVEAAPPVSSRVQLSVDGNALTIDPDSGYAGSFQVMLTVSDGFESVSQAFMVTVVNNAPVLVAIADQEVSHTTDSFSLNLDSSDADGDSLTYQIEILGDPLQEKAYSLDQQYGLQAPDGALQNNYWQNARGYNEKYLNGFFLLDNGALYQWGGSIDASYYISTLDSRFYDDPLLLAEATPWDPAQVAASLSGSVLTIDPADGFRGTFQVRVSATDGVQTATETFTVAVVNHAPQMDPVGDQTISHTTDSITLSLKGTDSDGDPLNWSAEVADDPLARLAWDLDQQYDLHALAGSVENNYWYNARGAGEKYLADGFFLLPDGSLYLWGGSIAGSTLITTLDASYHADPSLLTEAVAPAAAGATVSFNGSDLTIDPPNGYAGTFQVTISLSDGANVTLQTISVHVTNNPPALAPVDDQIMAAGDDVLTVDFTAGDADGDPLSFSVDISADPVTQLAWDLDQQYALDVLNGSVENNYWFNARGTNEKYLANGYFLLSDGLLYQWGGSIANSTLIATLDASFYNDPTLLAHAQLPSAENVIADVSGSTLTLDPDAAYQGRFQVRVTASDGIDSTVQTFLVHREQSGATGTLLGSVSAGPSVAERGSTEDSVQLRNAAPANPASIIPTVKTGHFREFFGSRDEAEFDVTLPLNSETASGATPLRSWIGDLNAFLDSLPGLVSVSEAANSEGLGEPADDNRDDLDEALDRIFSEEQTLPGNVSLLEELLAR